MGIKRILITSLVCFLAVSLFAGYFYHVGTFAAAKGREVACSKVNVHILDSLESSAIERGDVRKMLDTALVGKKIDSIDLSLIERRILSHGEIRTSKVYISPGGALNVAVTQRKPVARFENPTERYYSDEYGYLFPVSKHIEVPVVTGSIPLSRGSDFKGYTSSEEALWINGIISFIQETGKDPYWKKHIQQIDIGSNGDILLYLDCGAEKIIFGDCRNIGSKLKKLRAYYENIAPRHEANTFSTVNLKYKNQIICK